MIDTIKVGIPLSKNQYNRLQRNLLGSDHWQWIQYHAQTGELRFIRHQGLAKLDGESFHRDIRWDIPDRYQIGDEPTLLTLELSLPKFVYGHNIRLLYGWVTALEELKKQLEKQLSCRFPPVTDWKVKRLDPCYTWDCPSQDTAQTLLECLKRLPYPRKKPTKNDTSISFTGKTYTFKFYLKLPEFIIHDRKVLLKAKASLEWINHLEKLATGVIRCEATLRQKYLVRQGIRTVADLIEPIRKLEINLEGELARQDNKLLVEGEDFAAATNAILTYQKTKGLDLASNFKSGIETPINEIITFSAPDGKLELNGNIYLFPGGSLTIQVTDKPVAILQYFLEKFIGKNKGMDEIGKVQEKLLAKYKPDKALRLLGFYTTVIKIGVDNVKKLYSETVYYRNKADLKIAGVSLLEPDIVVTVDKQFIDSFKFEIPSIHTTNRFDDFRNHGNLLNEKLEDEV